MNQGADNLFKYFSSSSRCGERVSQNRYREKHKAQADSYAQHYAQFSL